MTTIYIHTVLLHSQAKSTSQSSLSYINAGAKGFPDDTETVCCSSCKNILQKTVEKLPQSLHFRFLLCLYLFLKAFT